jgi:hypothetical protein
MAVRPISPSGQSYRERPFDIPPLWQEDRGPALWRLLPERSCPVALIAISIAPIRLDSKPVNNLLYRFKVPSFGLCELSLGTHKLASKRHS